MKAREGRITEFTKKLYNKKLNEIDSKNSGNCQSPNSSLQVETTEIVSIFEHLANLASESLHADIVETVGQVR